MILCIQYDNADMLKIVFDCSKKHPTQYDLVAWTNQWLVSRGTDQSAASKKVADRAASTATAFEADKQAAQGLLVYVRIEATPTIDRQPRPLWLPPQMNKRHKVSVFTSEARLPQPWQTFARITKNNGYRNID